MNLTKQEIIAIKLLSWTPRTRKVSSDWARYSPDIKVCVLQTLIVSFTKALLGMHEPEEAKKKFEAILQFDPNNKAAHNQVVICNAKIREQREKDKKLYANIFTKMAEHDRQVSDQWRFGWWDEAGKGVQLDVDLEEVDREKQAAIEEAKEARRKEHREYLKRYGGKAPPRPLGKDGKPLQLADDEEEEQKTEKQDESVRICVRSA